MNTTLYINLTSFRTSFRKAGIIRRISIIAMLLLSITIYSCKKFVEIDQPGQSLTAAKVYANPSSAAATVTNLYIQMQSSNASNSFATLSGWAMGLSADELKTVNATGTLETKTYKNQLSAVQGESPAFWSQLFALIYKANVSMEGISASTALPQNLKNQLIGEDLFMRAFCYFYLVNIYGDVPLLTTSDYRINAVASRSNKSDVYKQIVLDLKNSQNLLSENYLTPKNVNTTERIRPNRYAATALLARVYLYMQDWTNAELEASKLIQNSSVYKLEPVLNNVFLKNSNEAIWQLQSVSSSYNTEDGAYYIPNASATTYNAALGLSTYVLNAFELGDNRQTNWVGIKVSGGSNYYYPYKYKFGNPSSPGSENLTVLRLSEQYLIRAEARAQLNKFDGAKSDLNAIRNRAGLGNTTANDQASLITTILHERQVELFTEWGHRWLDLKRTGNINSVMAPVTTVKGGTWNSNAQLYPIPVSDILNNSNLTQNTGY